MARVVVNGRGVYSHLAEKALLLCLPLLGARMNALQSLPSVGGGALILTLGSDRHKMRDTWANAELLRPRVGMVRMLAQPHDASYE